ncbi:DUF4432 family protein [Agromyces sp. NPDC058064]|uniref:DUF4432 family protein n=1 Tax=Agromyces sp. NPDC058064 TaxID=3346322 RepID=UPI0036DA0169
MTITISSSMFEVVVAPERGADIVQVVDRATGVATLTAAPTATDDAPPPPSRDSKSRWHDGYPGGWQFLTPNAGPEREHNGILQGYHGESALSRWQLLAADESSAVLGTRLTTAPFALQRRLAVDASGLRVTDTVRNLADVDVSARMLQHPAFGAPFLDSRSYLVTDARTLITDEEAPGTLAEANVAGAPHSILTPGPVASSIALPGPGARRSLFAALADFPTAKPSVVFASPTHGFGMQLTWKRVRYPVAWLWIEANAEPNWPWFGRMYAIAVEPANLLPGAGEARTGTTRGGDGTVVRARGSVRSTVRLSRVALARASGNPG